MTEPKKWKGILRGMALPLLAVAFIGAFYVYASGRFIKSTPEVRAEDGVVDIHGVPLDTQIYHLVNNWDFYAGHLFGPEDFRNGNQPAPKDPAEVRDDHKGTYRVRIQGEPNTYISLCSYSIDYSMRIFVDGREVRNFGNVSDNPDEVVHGGHYFTLPLYIGDSGEVEIIYQYANYMHHDGGFIQATFIGTPEVVDNYVRGMTIFSLFTGGGLLFLAFYFLMYAACQKNREYGVLAACCIMIAFRNAFFVREFLLQPDFPFVLHYRTFVMVVSMIPTMAVFLPAAYFPKVIGKKLERVFAAICVVLAALHYVLPTESLVGLCHISYYICIAWAILVIVLFVRYAVKKERPGFADVLIFGIILMLFFVMLYEGIHTNDSSLIAHFGATPFGLLICILVLSILASRKIQRKINLLAEEQRKNVVLGQINTMNRDFLQTVAHELRTPLSVISGYAQLTEMQIEKGRLSPQTPERLHTIRSEADRLGAMVANLMAYTYGEANEAELHMVDPKELLHNAELIAEPVCEKKGNRLKTACETEAMLHGNFELLLQVLINMIVNASRHTENGEISVGVKDGDGVAVFTVCDTGTGIGEEAAGHIFERGYSADGGNGLGLAICMDTIRMHGGELELTSTGPQGTTFTFTVPKEK